MSPGGPMPEAAACRTNRMLIGVHNLHEPIARHVRREFSTVPAGATVGEALAALRSQQLGERIVYFYVADDDGRLVGVVPTRRLLMSPLDRPIDQIMSREVWTIPASATVLQACEEFMRHRFLALPVIDDEGRLVGVVDVGMFTDEVVVQAERMESERAFQLIGVHVALGRQAPLLTSFKDRFPWLLCNIAGGIICALLASRFESLLDAAIVLAMFIPVVLTVAESVSMQSLTLTLQGLEHRNIHWRLVAAGLRKEFLVALLLGSASGSAVGLICLVWKGGLVVSAAIALSITLAMVTACLLGVAIPTAVRAMQGNPRIAAGPIALALTDIATLAFYFILCGIMLR